MEEVKIGMTLLGFMEYLVGITFAAVAYSQERFWFGILYPGQCRGLPQ
jgi:hypothetical protein